MLKLMIVDDMDIVRRELKRFTLWGEKSGFVISEEARDGYEALNKLRNNPVDIVMTDIRMPKIDGIELLKEITEEDLCPCVVLISDYSEFNYARQGLVLGAFDYIVKPVDEAELAGLLERARAFIVNKKIEQQRVQQLEQSVAEKEDMYFSSLELSQLVELIKARDVRASEYAAHIADTVCANIGQDPIKIESILTDSLGRIISGVQESCKWLDKFISTPGIEAISFKPASLKDIASMKAAFVSEIQSLAVLLTKLHYGAQEKGIADQVCRCVLENIDGEVSLKTVSDTIFMNRTYVSEAFKQKTGISFTEYLTFVKMERAKKLIREGKLKSYETAELLGFKDIEYFSKLFKKHTGLSPTEYKQNTLKND